MIGNIANLARWEWSKLGRRWMLWILLAFAILFAQLAVWGEFFSYRDLQETGGQIRIPATLQEQAGRPPRTVACNDLLSGDAARQPDLDAQVIAGLAAQCRQQAATQPDRLARAHQSFTIPGVFSSALEIVQTLGLILVAILTASAIGIDYGSGTLRSVLTKGTGRWPYLTAKLITLSLIAGAGLLITLATAGISGVVAGAIAGAAPTSAAVTAPLWSDALKAFGKAWVSLLPYVALTAFVTVLARSSAAGMAIGLGYYFLEQILIALLSGLFSWFQDVANLMLVRNISAWTQPPGGGGGTGALGAGPLPDATQAILVLAIYTLALLAGAFWLFERRDVQGATGG